MKKPSKAEKRSGHDVGGAGAREVVDSKEDGEPKGDQKADRRDLPERGGESRGQSTDDSAKPNFVSSHTGKPPASAGTRSGTEPPAVYCTHTVTVIFYDPDVWKYNPQVFSHVDVVNTFNTTQEVTPFDIVRRTPNSFDGTAVLRYQKNTTAKFLIGCTFDGKINEENYETSGSYTKSSKRRQHVFREDSKIQIVIQDFFEEKSFSSRKLQPTNKVIQPSPAIVQEMVAREIRGELELEQMVRNATNVLELLGKDIPPNIVPRSMISIATPEIATIDIMEALLVGLCSKHMSEKGRENFQWTPLRPPTLRFRPAISGSYVCQAALVSALRVLMKSITTDKRLIAHWRYFSCACHNWYGQNGSYRGEVSMFDIMCEYSPPDSVIADVAPTFSQLPKNLSISSVRAKLQSKNYSDTFRGLGNRDQRREIEIVLTFLKQSPSQSPAIIQLIARSFCHTLAKVESSTSDDEEMYLDFWVLEFAKVQHDEASQFALARCKALTEEYLRANSAATAMPTLFYYACHFASFTDLSLFEQIFSQIPAQPTLILPRLEAFLDIESCPSTLQDREVAVWRQLSPKASVETFTQVCRAAAEMMKYRTSLVADVVQRMASAVYETLAEPSLHLQRSFSSPLSFKILCDMTYFKAVTAHAALHDDVFQSATINNAILALSDLSAFCDSIRNRMLSFAVIKNLSITLDTRDVPTSICGPVLRELFPNEDLLQQLYQQKCYLEQLVTAWGKYIHALTLLQQREGETTGSFVSDEKARLILRLAEMDTEPLTNWDSPRQDIMSQVVLLSKIEATRLWPIILREHGSIRIASEDGVLLAMKQLTSAFTHSAELLIKLDVSAARVLQLYRNTSQIDGEAEVGFDERRSSVELRALMITTQRNKRDRVRDIIQRDVDAMKLVTAQVAESSAWVAAVLASVTEAAIFVDDAKALVEMQSRQPATFLVTSSAQALETATPFLCLSQITLEENNAMQVHQAYQAAQHELQVFFPCFLQGLRGICQEGVISNLLSTFHTFNEFQAMYHRKIQGSEGPDYELLQELQRFVETVYPEGAHGCVLTQTFRDISHLIDVLGSLSYGVSSVLALRTNIGRLVTIFEQDEDSTNRNVNDALELVKGGVIRFAVSANPIVGRHACVVDGKLPSGGTMTADRIEHMASQMLLIAKDSGDDVPPIADVNFTTLVNESTRETHSRSLAQALVAMREVIERPRGLLATLEELFMSGHPDFQSPEPFEDRAEAVALEASLVQLQAKLSEWNGSLSKHLKRHPHLSLLTRRQLVESALVIHRSVRAEIAAHAEQLLRCLRPCRVASAQDFASIRILLPEETHSLSQCLDAVSMILRVDISPAFRPLRIPHPFPAADIEAVLSAVSRRDRERALCCCEVSFSAGNVPIFLLLVYASLRQRLPLHVEVFECTEDTTTDSLRWFLDRARAAPFDGALGEATTQDSFLFSLIFVENLPQSVAHDLSKEISSLRSAASSAGERISCAPILIVSTGSSKMTQLLDSGDFVVKIPEIEMKRVVSVLAAPITKALNGMTKIVQSDAPGDGKSMLVLRTECIGDRCVTSLPLDSPSPMDVLRLLRKCRMQRAALAVQPELLVYHLNVSAMLLREHPGIAGNYLFAIGILRCISDSSGEVLPLNGEDLILFELPDEGAPGRGTPLTQAPIAQLFESMTPPHHLHATEISREPAADIDDCVIYRVAILENEANFRTLQVLKAFIQADPQKCMPHITVVENLPRTDVADSFQLVRSVIDLYAKAIRPDIAASWLTAPSFLVLRFFNFAKQTLPSVLHNPMYQIASLGDAQDQAVHLSYIFCLVRECIRMCIRCALPTIRPPSDDDMEDCVARFTNKVSFQTVKNDPMLTLLGGEIVPVNLSARNVLQEMTRDIPSGHFRQAFADFAAAAENVESVRAKCAVLSRLNYDRECEDPATWLFQVVGAVPVRAFLSPSVDYLRSAEGLATVACVRRVLNDRSVSHVTAQQFADMMRRLLSEVLWTAGEPFVLTIDELVKLFFIKVRIAAYQPVFFSGETGCGKTHIGHYFARLSGMDFEVMNVHGAVAAQGFHDRLFPLILRAREYLKTNGRGILVLLDEVNTSGAVWIAKELLCDRMLLGIAIPNNIHFFCNMNPYRFRTRSHEAALARMDVGGLKATLYRDAKVFGSSSSSSLAPSEQRPLVYQVHRVPESLMSLVWDFGSASLNALDQAAAAPWFNVKHAAGTYSVQLHRTIVTDETLFALRMLDARVVDGVLSRDTQFQDNIAHGGWNQLSYYKILVSVTSELIAAAQDHIRVEYGNEESVVSLRDIHRTCTLIAFLYKFQQHRAEVSDFSQKGKPALYVGTAVSAALISNYGLRLDKQRRRALTQTLVTRWALVRRLFTGIDVDPHFMSTPVSDSALWSEFTDLSGFLCGHLQQDKSIAHNEAMRENCFSLFVSIYAKNAQFIVGRPGTSKSHSLDALCATSTARNVRTRGEIASSIFEFYPRIRKFVLQCSPYTTAANIEHKALVAAREQFNSRRGERFAGAEDDTICVLVLEEVGTCAFASSAKHNPLMTLHGIIDHGVSFTLEKTGKLVTEKVPVVGISNWELDGSKMNRGRTTYRSNPDEEDMLETASKIIMGCGIQDSQAIRQCLIRTVRAMHRSVIEDPKFNWYYGMRDFYALVKFLCLHADPSTTLRSAFHHMRQGGFLFTPHLVRWALAINVSGLPNSQDQQELTSSMVKAMCTDECHAADALTREKATGMSLCSHCTLPVLMSYQRNGEPLKKVVQDHFERSGDGHQCQQFPNDEHVPGAKQILSWAIQESSSRYVLLFTRAGAALSALCVHMNLGSQYDLHVIMGYDLRQNHISAVQKLLEVRTAIRTGKLLIMVGCKDLYESILDLTNQHFSVEGKKKYTRLSIGINSSEDVMVHPNFRLIVVEEMSRVEYLSPPFINRFVKVVLTYLTMLTTAQRNLASTLLALCVASMASGSEVDVLEFLIPGYHVDTVASCAACAPSEMSSTRETRAVGAEKAPRLHRSQDGDDDDLNVVEIDESRQRDGERSSGCKRDRYDTPLATSQSAPERTSTQLKKSQLRTVEGDAIINISRLISLRAALSFHHGLVPQQDPSITELLATWVINRLNNVTSLSEEVAAARQRSSSDLNESASSLLLVTEQRGLWLEDPMSLKHSVANSVAPPVSGMPLMLWESTEKDVIGTLRGVKDHHTVIFVVDMQMPNSLPVAHLRFLCREHLRSKLGVFVLIIVVIPTAFAAKRREVPVLADDTLSSFCARNSITEDEFRSENHDLYASLSKTGAINAAVAFVPIGSQAFAPYDAIFDPLWRMAFVDEVVPVHSCLISCISSDFESVQLEPVVAMAFLSQKHIIERVVRQFYHRQHDCCWLAESMSELLLSAGLPFAELVVGQVEQVLREENQRGSSWMRCALLYGLRDTSVRQTAVTFLEELIVRISGKLLICILPHRNTSTILAMPEIWLQMMRTVVVHTSATTRITKGVLDATLPNPCSLEDSFATLSGEVDTVVTFPFSFWACGVMDQRWTAIHGDSGLFEEGLRDHPISLIKLPQTTTVAQQRLFDCFLGDLVGYLLPIPVPSAAVSLIVRFLTMSNFSPLTSSDSAGDVVFSFMSCFAFFMERAVIVEHLARITSIIPESDLLSATEELFDIGPHSLPLLLLQTTLRASGLSVIVSLIPSFEALFVNRPDVKPFWEFVRTATLVRDSIHSEDDDSIALLDSLFPLGGNPVPMSQLQDLFAPRVLEGPAGISKYLVPHLLACTPRERIPDTVKHVVRQVIAAATSDTTNQVSYQHMNAILFWVVNSISDEGVVEPQEVDDVLGPFGACPNSSCAVVMQEHLSQRSFERLIALLDCAKDSTSRRLITIAFIKKAIRLDCADAHRFCDLADRLWLSLGQEGDKEGCVLYFLRVVSKNGTMTQAAAQYIRELSATSRIPRFVVDHPLTREFTKPTQTPLDMTPVALEPTVRATFLRIISGDKIPPEVELSAITAAGSFVLMADRSKNVVLENTLQAKCPTLHRIVEQWTSLVDHSGVICGVPSRAIQVVFRILGDCCTSPALELLSGATNASQVLLPGIPRSTAYEACKTNPPQFHLYLCPNNHPYVTSDCEHINSEGHCAECKARIGGPRYNVPHPGNRRLGTIGEIDRFLEFFPEEVGYQSIPPDVGYSCRGLDPVTCRLAHLVSAAAMFGRALACGESPAVVVSFLGDAVLDLTTLAKLWGIGADVVDGAADLVNYFIAAATTSRITKRCADRVSIEQHLADTMITLQYFGNVAGATTDVGRLILSGLHHAKLHLSAQYQISPNMFLLDPHEAPRCLLDFCEGLRRANETLAHAPVECAFHGSARATLLPIAQQGFNRTFDTSDVIARGQFGLTREISEQHGDGGMLIVSLLDKPGVAISRRDGIVVVDSPTDASFSLPVVVASRGAALPHELTSHAQGPLNSTVLIGELASRCTVTVNKESHMHGTVFDKISFSQHFIAQGPPSAFHFICRRELNYDDLRDVMRHEAHRFPRLLALDKVLASITEVRRNATAHILAFLRAAYDANNKRLSRTARRADGRNFLEELQHRNARWLINEAVRIGTVTQQDADDLLKNFCAAYKVLAPTVHRYECKDVHATLLSLLDDPGSILLSDLLPSGPSDGIITRSLLFGLSRDGDHFPIASIQNSVLLQIHFFFTAAARPNSLPPMADELSIALARLMQLGSTPRVRVNHHALLPGSTFTFTFDGENAPLLSEKLRCMNNDQVCSQLNLQRFSAPRVPPSWKRNMYELCAQDLICFEESHSEALRHSAVEIAPNQLEYRFASDAYALDSVVVYASHSSVCNSSDSNQRETSSAAKYPFIPTEADIPRFRYIEDAEMQLSDLLDRHVDQTSPPIVLKRLLLEASLDEEMSASMGEYLGILSNALLTLPKHIISKTQTCREFDLAVIGASACTVESVARGRMTLLSSPLICSLFALEHLNAARAWLVNVPALAMSMPPQFCDPLSEKTRASVKAYINTASPLDVISAVETLRRAVLDRIHSQDLETNEILLADVLDVPEVLEGILLKNFRDIVLLMDSFAAATLAAASESLTESAYVISGEQLKAVYRERRRAIPQQAANDGDDVAAPLAQAPPALPKADPKSARAAVPVTIHRSWSSSTSLRID